MSKVRLVLELVCHLLAQEKAQEEAPPLSLRTLGQHAYAGWWWGEISKLSFRPWDVSASLLHIYFIVIKPQNNGLVSEVHR